MADITVAATQDEIADSLVSPVQQEEPAGQTSVAEQQETLDVSEQPVEQQEETQQEEVADWLPTEQDKIFPDEVLSRYAQRYGLDENLLANPQLKQLVIDKINTDIFLRQQQEQQQELPEVEPEPEPQVQAQPQLPTREQYFQNLTQMVQARTDPEVAKAFHNEFLGLWNLPPEQQPMAFAQVASKYMLNLVNTFIPDILQQALGPQLNQAFPGFGEMYERSSYAMAWDRVRNSEPAYSNLPAYGSKEFSKTLREAAGKYPGFDEMQFTDAQGKPLGMMENAMRKYAMLAQVAAGGAVDPSMVQQAVAAGARQARNAQVKRAAGNLGSGQSRGGAPAKSSKFTTNADIFDDATMAFYQREHGRI